MIDDGYHTGEVVQYLDTAFCTMIHLAGMTVERHKDIRWFDVDYWLVTFTPQCVGRMHPPHGFTAGLK